MALPTVELAMRTGQRILGLSIVVEYPEIPAIGVMARLALRAKRCFVRIIGPVAGITVSWAVCKNTVAMTFLTLNNSVHSYQWQPSKIVIKPNVLGP